MNHHEQRGGKEGLWAILLLAVCCIVGTLILLATGTGVAAVGAARASTWLLVGGIALIVIALLWLRTKKAGRRTQQ